MMETVEILKRLCEASYEAVPDSETHKAIIEIMTPLSEKIKDKRERYAALADRSLKYFEGE